MVVAPAEEEMVVVVGMDQMQSRLIGRQGFVISGNLLVIALLEINAILLMELQNYTDTEGASVMQKLRILMLPCPTRSKVEECL